jgi:hypothetical protein
MGGGGVKCYCVYRPKLKSLGKLKKTAKPPSKLAMRIPALVLLAGMLTGCASHSIISQRNPTDPGGVILYVEPPGTNYVVLGKVWALWPSSRESSISKLKREAAELGANGIIIQQVDTEMDNGLAIFVDGPRPN